MFLSLRTVESHLTSAYRKLEIESRGNIAAALRSSDRRSVGPITSDHSPGLTAWNSIR